MSPTTTIQQMSSTLSPAIVPQGQSESLILNFLFSPTGTELTQLEIEEFLHSKRDLIFLTQMNGALAMLNKKLFDSELLQNQINDLSELFFISTLNSYY